MSDLPLHRLLDELPESNLTTAVLHGLDYLAPGEWQNIRNLDEMIKSVTGESDEAVIQAVGEKAIALYADPANGFQRALSVFKKVDSVGTLAGALSVAHALGSRFEALSFIGDHTPKDEVTQSVDAGIKFAAELAAFCLTNGIPGDSVGDFVGALTNSAKEDKMRITAWLAFDCVLPLGPDAIQKVLGAVRDFSEDHLGSHGGFQKIAGFLPGSIGDQKNLIVASIQESSGFLQGQVAEKGITQGGLFDKAKEWIDFGDRGMDAAAAAIDLLTNWFEHTGTQTVARRVVARAYGEM